MDTYEQIFQADVVYQSKHVFQRSVDFQCIQFFVYFLYLVWSLIREKLRTEQPYS